MLDTLANIALALAALTLGETITVAGIRVTRCSLLGYQVGTSVLELDEATCTIASRLSAPVQNPIRDLVNLPHESFNGLVSETWISGGQADRRESQLRSSTRVTRRSHGGTVTFDYPASAKVPAIGTPRRTRFGLETVYDCG